MELNKNIPAIRFNGFEDDWDEKILSDVIGYRNGKAHENYIDINGNYIVVNSKFVSTNGLIKKFSNKQFAPLDKDEIAFVLSDVPNGRAIARTYLIDSNNKYTLNQRIAALSPKENFYSYFLDKLLNRNIYFLKFDDGVKQINLKRSDVERFSAKYPNYTEQTQIGNFFKTLDEQINLLDQKHQKLVNLKKAMLEKMFPKEGAYVPEIRFKGFTEKWEEKSLSEYLEVSKDKNKSLDYTKNDVLSVSGEFGIVNQIAFQGRSFAGVSVANYGIVNKGNIVYTKSPLKSNPYGIIKSNQFQTGIVSTLYAVYKCKNNVDDCFVEYYFTKDDRLNK